MSSPELHTRTSIQDLPALIISGRDEVLRYAGVLESLACKFEQSGAMSWLAYFLSGSSIRFKSPRLVLLLASETHAELFPAESILGCALFSEYVIFGWKTGAVCTEDTSGFRTVLAPAEHRADVATRCASALINHGAQIVLATYNSTRPADLAPATKRRASWAERTRSLGTQLDLLPTYEQLLAQFNRTVRFRLGYFRRRLMSTTPLTYVPDAATELTEEQFLALNRVCLNPVRDDEAVRRWRACRLAGGYVVGLRTADGHWLALIGGWRQGDTTVLHWQQNSAGWEKHSLTTVMRSYYLEHETARESKRIVFYGGTPHSIRRYFRQEDVTDLILRREGLRSRVMMWMAAKFAARGAALHKPNFLADTLSDATLRWSPTAQASDERAKGTARAQNLSTT